MEQDSGYWKERRQEWAREANEHWFASEEERREAERQAVRRKMEWNQEVVRFLSETERRRMGIAPLQTAESEQNENSTLREAALGRVIGNAVISAVNRGRRIFRRG